MVELLIGFVCFYLFLADVYKFYKKLTLEIKKKSTYLVKVPFFPLIPFHIKKTQITSPPKLFPVMTKSKSEEILARTVKMGKQK
jgi:hypothetical protein